MCSALGHAMSRGTVAHVTTQPATPEGLLLRDARTLAGLTARQAAEAIGLSLKQWGEAERGTSGGREFHPPDRTLALMAGSLGITAGQLTAAGRADAARILGTLPDPVAAHGAPDLADTDALIEEFIARSAGAERDTLEYLWLRLLDGDGRLKPRAERVRAVLGWVREHRPGQDAEQAG